MTIYVIACLFVVVFAYAHLSKIARDYNTQHMELITGIYAEKVNDAMEYVKNYATEEAKLIETMAQVEPENVLEHMQERLDQMSFANRVLILSDQEILGNTCAVNDIKKSGIKDLHKIKVKGVNEKALKKYYEDTIKIVADGTKKILKAKSTDEIMKYCREVDEKIERIERALMVNSLWMLMVMY